MAFEAVEAVGVAAFDDADAFGAAEGRLEADFPQDLIGVIAECSERVSEGVGSDACDIGDLVLQMPDIGGQELCIRFFGFGSRLGHAVALGVGMTVIGVVLDLPVAGQMHFQDVVPGQVGVVGIFVRGLTEVVGQLSDDGDDRLHFIFFQQRERVVIVVVVAVVE